MCQVTRKRNFFFLTENVYVMIRGDLYNENVVSENMSHNFSDIVKNLTGKVVIIFLQAASFPLNMKSRLNENSHISA